MFFAFDGKGSIHVPFPFNRVMTPYMMPETATSHIDFSIHMTEWEPGAEVDEHIHDSGMEAMYCLSGSGTASVGGTVYEFTPNTMIAAAPGERHRIRNTGTEKLRVLCIFSPPVTAEGLRLRAESAVAEYNKQQGK